MEVELSLLDAAKRMDKDALVRIFELYASPLYTYALRLCGDPALADHVVGDVFAKLLEQLAVGKGPTSNLRSYLYESAHNRVIDEARASQRRVTLDVLAGVQPDVRAELLSAEDRIVFKQVLDAIQKDLTPDQRHVLVLRFLEEFSVRETAAILGKEISHVKVIQGRALAKLRKVFRSQELRGVVSLPRVRAISKSLHT